MKHTVDPVADVELVLERLDMNVRGPLFDGPLQQQVDQADHRGFGREVLEVLDIGFLVAGIFFQVLDKGAHRAAAPAVVTLDQLLDVAALADGQAHRALAGIFQRMQGIGLVRVGDQYMQLAARGGQRHQAMFLEKARRQFGRLLQQFGRIRQGQQRGIEQGRPGQGKVLLRHQAQARQQFGRIVPCAGVLQLLGAVDIGEFQATLVDQPVDGQPARVGGHQGVHDALSRLHASGTA